MNASRLLEIVNLLASTERKRKIQEALSNANSALSSLVSQPSQPSHQSEFAAALEKLRTLMNEVREGFQPAQVKLLEEIGAAQFFTNDLASKIAGWVAENVATPAVAQEKLSTLLSERETYLTEIRQLRENLVKVGIEVNGLEVGQAEIGFLLPRELFDNNLDHLIKELDVVKKIMRTFSEAATGSVEPIEVRQISTSDPLFFFGLAPETIALIGASITWALHTWKQAEEIRKIRAETEKIAAFKDDPIERLFEDKIKSQVEQALTAQTAEIMKEVKGDRARKNEQKTQIKWALESIISRVERGMIVEIRLLPPPIPKANEGEEQPEPPPVFGDLNRIASQLVFPKMEGAPILQIPPSEPEPPRKSATKND